MLTRSIYVLVISLLILSHVARAQSEIVIDHLFGETIISESPKRVVSLGYSDQDNLLALGIIPIAIRDWYGNQPYAVWPWAQSALGSAKPVLLNASLINFEQIAALEPDLIIAASAGLTPVEYEKLSLIAPTIASPPDVPPFSIPWDVKHRHISEAFGLKKLAEQQIQDIVVKFKNISRTHTEFQGKTAAVAFYYNREPGVYASTDIRSEFLSNLGFIIPASFDEYSAGSFYFTFSEERMDLIDVDLVIWLATESEISAAITPRFYALLPFHRFGREFFTGDIIGGAFSFFSPLSIHFLLDNLVPSVSEIILKSCASDELQSCYNE